MQWPDILRMLGWKFAQLGLGILICSVTAYPFMERLRRTDLLNQDANPLLQIGINFARVLRKSRCCFMAATRGFLLRWCCVRSRAVCD